MKTIKTVLVTVVLGMSMIWTTNLSHAETIAGPIKVKCERTGTPHISKRNNILVCMLNHTRCCIWEISYSNGMSGFLVETDNGETFEIESYTYVGTDDEGNVTYSIN